MALPLRSSWYEAAEDPLDGSPARRSKLSSVLADPVVAEVLEVTENLGLPVYLNRYVARAIPIEEYAGDMERIWRDSRFAGFDLYEFFHLAPAPRPMAADWSRSRIEWATSGERPGNWVWWGVEAARSEALRSQRDRTSAESLSPSPMKLTASTVRAMAAPGDIQSQGHFRQHRRRLGLVEHSSPTRRGRGDSQAQKAEGRLQQDGVGEPEGGDDAQRAHGVGEDVPQDDARVAVAQGPGGHDELLFPEHPGPLPARLCRCPDQPSSPMTRVTEARLGPRSDTNSITMSRTGMLIMTSVALITRLIDGPARISRQRSQQRTDQRGEGRPPGCPRSARSGCRGSRGSRRPFRSGPSPANGPRRAPG